MNYFLIILLFIFISSCGGPNAPRQEQEIFQMFLKLQNSSDGTVTTESSAQKLDVFPVLLDDIEESKGIKIFKGNDALDYFIKESLFPERLLTKAQPRKI